MLDSPAALDLAAALLDAGADPSHGGPSAREVAQFFDLPEMLAVLDRTGSS